MNGMYSFLFVINGLRRDGIYKEKMKEDIKKEIEKEHKNSLNKGVERLDKNIDRIDKLVQMLKKFRIECETSRDCLKKQYSFLCQSDAIIREAENLRGIVEDMRFFDVNYESFMEGVELEELD